MASFHLQIVTPDAAKFDGQAERIIVRTVTGDACILAGHIDYTAPLDIGEAKVVDADGNARYAACNNGLISVHGQDVRVAATTFEWADEIDTQRADKSREDAQKRIAGMQRTDAGYVLVEARLRRALARLSACKH